MAVSIKKICVIGGGNIGTYVAVYAKLKGYEVSLYVSDETKFSKTLQLENEDEEKLFSVEIDCITSDIKTVLDDVDVIFITYPAFMFKDLNSKILPYINKNINICVLPGTGGAEFAFKDCIKNGVKFFGLQRVPLVARLVEYGKRVRIGGKRQQLYLGGIDVNQNELKMFSSFLENLFETRCSSLPNYLCVTLTPSNQILHTTRLYCLFKDYKDGVVYDRNFLFYEEWNNASSNLLLKCNSELQDLCSGIKELDLKSVISLKNHYESTDEFQLTKKITSIKSFKGLYSPMRKIEKGWVPDFASHYFSADFPFGLKVLIEIAKIFDVSVVSMDLIWEWYKKLCYEQAKNSFELKTNREEFISLYQ